MGRAMDSYFEDDAAEPATPIDPGRTAILALSTTVLAVVFLLLLIGDQVTAAAF
jgi:hypothetical protein